LEKLGLIDLDDVNWFTAAQDQNQYQQAKLDKELQHAAKLTKRANKLLVFANELAHADPVCKRMSDDPEFCDAVVSLGLAQPFAIGYFLSEKELIFVGSTLTGPIAFALTSCSKDGRTHGGNATRLSWIQAGSRPSLRCWSRGPSFSTRTWEKSGVTAAQS